MKSSSRDAAPPRPPAVPSHLPTPPFISPTTGFASSFVNAVSRPSTSSDPISNSDSSPFASTNFAPVSFAIRPSAKSPASRPSALSISTARAISPSLATSWLDSLGGPPVKRETTPDAGLPMDNQVGGASKRPRLDLEEEPAAFVRNGKAGRRDQVGSTDEFPIRGGDRLAHGLSDPARPSSESNEFIPVRYRPSLYR